MKYRKVGSSFLKTLQNLVYWKNTTVCLPTFMPGSTQCAASLHKKLFCGLSNYKDNRCPVEFFVWVIEEDGGQLAAIYGDLALSLAYCSI